MSEANRTKIITRGLRGIQLDSAMNWCDLAMESAKLFEENPTNLDYLDMFFEFKHEAEEHASGAEDDKYLAGIRAMLAQAQAVIEVAFRKRS